jgi:N-sulfoglucosamine sulfohydrolase
MKRQLFGAALCLLAAPTLATAGDSPAPRPNFLWLVAEDIGLAPLSCYGMQAEASTPAIDRLAADGMRFTRAYVTCPVCSPSRSAFMTGLYQTTIGAHNHRSHRDDGYQLPEGVKLITQWLKDAGYFTANVRGLPAPLKWKGTGKTDWNFTPPVHQFDSTRWDDLVSHQPFFAQINFSETHRPFRAPKRARPENVTLPPYYPDHPITRQDYAAYLDSATALDGKVADVLELLAKQGLVDSTVVIFFGDNGEAMVRGKQFCYEDGLRVPLIVRWPKNLPAPARWRAGHVDERLIEMIDMAPTMLSLAGAPVPRQMQGRVIFGEHAAPLREYAFGARDRCDETVFRLRAVCDARYRYIRNFTPERPFLQSNAYKEKQYPVWNLLKELHAQGKLTPPQQFLCAPTMPNEELYDLQADPHQIRNLASDQSHAAVLKRLRGALDGWLADSGDQGAKFEPEPVIRARGLTKPSSGNPNTGYTVDGGVPQ